jgi:hypothetical protein
MTDEYQTRTLREALTDGFVHFAFRLTSEVDAEGETEGGLPGVVWRVEIRVSVDGAEEDDDYDEDDETFILGTASAYRYPNAATTSSFGMDMDSSEEGVTWLGLEVLAGGIYADGTARDDIFDDESITDDILIIGEFQLIEAASAIDVVGPTVVVLTKVLGRGVGAVIVGAVEGDPAQDSSYWNSRGDFQQVPGRSVWFGHGAVI